MQYRIAQFGLFGLATTVLGHQHHQNNKHSSFHDRRLQNHGPFGMGNATYPFPSGSGAVHTPAHTPVSVAAAQDATITQVRTATVKAVQAESVATPVVDTAAVQAESVDESDDTEELCEAKTVTVTNPNKVTVTVTQPATSGVQGATSAPVVPVTPSSAAGVPSVPAASVPAASAPAGSAPAASVPAASSPAAVTSAPVVPGVPATQLTTSTVYSTQTTTDATGGVVTVTVPISTTVCPVTATEGASTPAASVPAASAPAGSAPAASVPAASAPAGSAPAASVPAASVPAASAPAGSAPAASVPAASAPAGSAPAASVPAASVPATSAPAAVTSAPAVPATQLTTSTIYSTQTSTDATGGVVTVTVPVSTTVCPVTAAEGASTPVAPVPTTDAAQITPSPAVSATQWTTSTIYSTQISTGADGGVTTITVPITTTVCPVTATEGAATPSSVAQTPAATPSSSAAAITSVVPSSTVSSSAVATPTSTASSTGKRGLVYNTFDLISQFTGLRWAYNWAQTPGGTMPDNMEFVPQLWGLRPQYDTPDWKSNAEEQISLGATHLLGYNEPDVEEGAGGSQLTPAEAAQGWMTYMQPFAGKAKLVSPGVCNGEGVRPATSQNQGLDWLEDFVSACSSCTIDKINIHWYASYTGMNSDIETVVTYFKEYTEKAYKKFNKPIWITEFELQDCSDAKVEAEFITKIDEYVSQTSYIERYSYFKTETIVEKAALKAAYIA